MLMPTLLTAPDDLQPEASGPLTAPNETYSVRCRVQLDGRNSRQTVIADISASSSLHHS